MDKCEMEWTEYEDRFLIRSGGAASAAFLISHGVYRTPEDVRGRFLFLANSVALADLASSEMGKIRFNRLAGRINDFDEDEYTFWERQYTKGIDGLADG